MTNEMIILFNSLELMKVGAIGTTGREFTYENEDGEKITMMEPEPIHTYTKWKELGYQVQKGEKAVAQFMIWKHVKAKSKDQEQENKTVKIENDEEKDKMFMKKASFFSLSQVKKIEENKAA